MKVSVALAAYNGEKYIEEQLNSILSQLSAEDEVIVSDDNPSGGTKAVVDALADPRIKYIEGPGRGVIKNFEYAIAQTKGDVIFLSDQDDVWLPGKVSTMTSAIEKGAIAVMHDAKVTDENLNVLHDSFFELNGSKKGYWKNIVKNSYMGCCMAFSASLKEKILPFPENLPMHDQWIGLKAEKFGSVEFIDTPFILYRRNSDSLTGGKNSLKQKLIWRFNILKDTL